jgi:hypothetical protein
MRWPWRRRTAVPRCASTDVDEASRARRQAEEALRRTVEQDPEVRRIAEQLRHHRRVNHFAELFGRSLGGL